MKSIIDLHPPIARPIRTVQFGEGNFLRAFIGELWQSANEDVYKRQAYCIISFRKFQPSYCELCKE